MNTSKGRRHMEWLAIGLIYDAMLGALIISACVLAFRHALLYRPLDYSNPSHRDLIAKAARHGVRYKNIRGAYWLRIDSDKYLLIEGTST
jgi:hypothetical protein